MTPRERAKILHERATKAVKLNVWSEKELVVVFYELDQFGGYRFYGAKNLYQYAMKVHKLTESTALNIINVARKSKHVPAIREAVVDGRLSVSTARKIVPVITKENADAWIELAQTEIVRDVERAVAEAKPELAVRESAKFVAKDRLAVTSSFDEEAYDKMRRVMDLESQRTRKASTQGEALVAALDAYLEKHDPLLKAERARDRELKKVACQTSASGNPAEFNVDSNALRFENSVPSNAPAPVTGPMLLH
ncbi:MAG: hypothetical protein AAB250_13335 [Bdellovibrionota bacterium]